MWIFSFVALITLNVLLVLDFHPTIERTRDLITPLLVCLCMWIVCKIELNSFSFRYATAFAATVCFLHFFSMLFCAHNSLAVAFSALHTHSLAHRLNNNNSNNEYIFVRFYKELLHVSPDRTVLVDFRLPTNIVFFLLLLFYLEWHWLSLAAADVSMLGSEHIHTHSAGVCDTLTEKQHLQQQQQQQQEHTTSTASRKKFRGRERESGWNSFILFPQRLTPFAPHTWYDGAFRWFNIHHSHSILSCHFVVCVFLWLAFHTFQWVA